MKKRNTKTGRKPFAALSLFAALTTALASQVLAETYDLVMDNGRANLDTDSSYNPTIFWTFVPYPVGSSDAALLDVLVDFSITFGGNIGVVDSALDDDLGLGDDSSDPIQIGFKILSS